MIHEGRIDLNVTYARKDEAKALGARWDGTRRLWYIPARTGLRGFDEAWCPAGLLNAVGTQVRNETAADGGPEKGVTLSELLGRIKGVLSQNLSDSVWVRAEISELSSKSGNVYL